MHKRLSLTVLVLILAVYPFCPIARAEAPPTTNPLKATADASSIFSSGFPAKFATDGDLNTRWCSSEPYGKREWLLVDLGKTQPIGRVEILWEVLDAFDDAVAVWHFKDLKDAAGANSALTALGAVKVGVPCGEAARAPSLARGGDGYMTDCTGGYLLAQVHFALA